MTQQAYNELMKVMNEARDRVLQAQRVCAWCNQRFDSWQQLADHIIKEHK